jgi:hypothetical protein
MTDWYIDQMKTKTYESEPLPISFTHDQYVDKLDYVHSKTESRWDIKTSSILLKPKIDCWHAEWTNDTLYPTNKIRIPDKSSIIKNKSSCG